MDACQSWVFVCRKAFDPTSALKWFGENPVRVAPNGPWQLKGRWGALANKWAVDLNAVEQEGPCADFYKTVHNYLGKEGECREYRIPKKSPVKSL